MRSIGTCQALPPFYKIEFIQLILLKFVCKDTLRFPSYESKPCIIDMHTIVGHGGTIRGFCLLAIF